MTVTPPPGPTSLPPLVTGANTIGKVDQGAGGAAAWKVDGSAVTQPVSGTVTANGTFWPTGAASPASHRLSDGAAFYDAAKTGQLPAALVGGRLDVNVGASATLPVSGAFWQATQPVSGTFWQAIQPVSGTVTANIGTPGTLALDATLTGGTAKSVARGGAKGTTTAGDVTSTNVDANTQALDVSVKGTATVAGTVTANIGTSGSLALDATLTGGTQKSISRGAAKGTTAAADVTSTAEGADHQALDVQIFHGGTAINPTLIRALTSADVLTVLPGNTPNTTAWLVTGTGGTFPVTDNAGSLTVDAPVGTPVFVRLSDGAAAIATLPVSLAALPALAAGSAVVGKVGIDQTTPGTTNKVSIGTDGTVAVNAALPAGDNVVGRTKITDGTNVVAVKAASTLATPADPAQVVVISPNNTTTTGVGTTISGANATVTLTLAAPGAGLFHYITRIKIVNVNPTTTAIAAAASTLGYTSTNLPGSLAWSAGTSLAAGAEKVVEDVTFDAPLKSSAANTATTIVAPAIGTGGVCRITVYYWTGA